MQSLTAKDSKPPFDAKQIADQMMYHELFARNEQPKWRKDIIKKHGPAGVSYDGYNDYAGATIWEWNWSSFGDMPIDKDGEVKFDGTNFTQRKEEGGRKIIKLEEWLIAILKEKDPEIFDDGKWKYKKIWYELIKVLEVRVNVTVMTDQ